MNLPSSNVQKREDINKILVLGAGPIVIGQACEFDYSGTQACKVLKDEGYEVVLVNSNPATIMTDPTLADRTYIEPLTVESLRRIIQKERPQAVLPTLGGQTALNLAMDLESKGVLKEFDVELLGASVDTIELAENRESFKRAMEEIGVPVPKSFAVHNLEEARKAKEELSFPIIIRAAFTLGGSGGSIAYNLEEFEELVQWGLTSSPISEVLLEESVLGWKEFELELMRDRADQVVVICGIENLDPMGIHTGDSTTVAPILTLADKEYQVLREYSKKIMRKVGVNTGGSNVQFAVNPENGRVVVIEMNPRVSRSSALASKATGFPIAKIAALLAIGYRLDEIKNDITGKTLACFEPTIDYVVTKIPRFNFDKFPQTPKELGPQMRSVGEVMAIGRTFQESLQKALRGLEVKTTGFNEILNKRPVDVEGRPEERREVTLRIREELQKPTAQRIFWVAEAFRYGMGLDQCYELTRIDPWFLRQIREIVLKEDRVRSLGTSVLRDQEQLRELKKLGFSDLRLSQVLEVKEEEVRKARWQHDICPDYLVVDTCAGEFPSSTPYYYSTYHQVRRDTPDYGGKRSVGIIGSGPNRIGQGIEFDYCCVHASHALREEGIRSVMINCNPETVSTDYDTSDALFFESLTVEDVLEVLRFQGIKEVVTYFGGQTPLMLSQRLEESGITLLGSSYDQIDLCEDRERFAQLIQNIGAQQTKSALATSREEVMAKVEEVGYPLLARPSYVIGGQGMAIVHREKDLERVLQQDIEISPETPLLLDSFLKDAIEVDVDALRDNEGSIWIPGIMEHIEEAGVHSGDSTCSFPPYTLSEEVQEKLKGTVRNIVKAIDVVGLINVQLAVKNGEVFVIEVNPRASRTVPFLSKAIRVPLAKMATRLLLGQSLKSFDIDLNRCGEVKTRTGTGFAVKMPVFPFIKFSNVDPILGPEMKSTGEVMGVGQTFASAFQKVMEAVYPTVPKKGGAFVSFKDEDKELMLDAVRKLQEMNFEVVATAGTALFLTERGFQNIRQVNKVLEGRPHVIDSMKNDEIHLVFNTTRGKKSVKDSQSIRRTALVRQVPYFTTVSGAYAAVEALERSQTEESGSYCLQGDVT